MDKAIKLSVEGKDGKTIELKLNGERLDEVIDCWNKDDECIC
jgi:uncharacterized protein Veg